MTTLGTATYSPEDNKLRFYPDSRLSKEDYDRARAHGFAWAPKQELFVAPMWTPEREDLLLEWCGEIGDEDKSLVERQEERADRFRDYSASRAEDADTARAAVSAIADNIPLGQPILVGHHSEKHARRDAERIENGMRKAVKMWETSQYWKQRAAGAIRLAKYKERPDVRARRIKKLEADKRRQERAKAESEHLLRFWRGELFAKNPTTGEKRPIEITEANRDFLFDLLGKMSCCGVRIQGKDGNGWFSAWDILRPAEDRYRNCPERTVAQLQESAITGQTGLIARYDRWIEHYNHRIEYERAMMAEQGGTAADKTGPEVGGGCRCWASPRTGWSYIQKVNRVSVTVLDNWGNGGADFPRVIPFDKLSKVMSKAQVDEARAAGRLIELGKRGFALCQETPTTPPPPVAKPVEPQAQEFAQLKEALKTGVQVVSAPQLFPTPPALVERMVERAEIREGDRVLEPSAGTGNIAAEVARNTKASLLCVELNPALAERLATLYPTECADFLTCNGNLGKFDRILMNPPFENGADVKHITHALSFLNPGGRLVAICANGPRQQKELQPIATSWEDLPAGTFKEQGTNVSTALVVIDK